MFIDQLEVRRFERERPDVLGLPEESHLGCRDNPEKGWMCMCNASAFPIGFVFSKADPKKPQDITCKQCQTIYALLENQHKAYLKKLGKYRSLAEPFQPHW